jgi:predicted small lipoprotein YifL
MRRPLFRFAVLAIVLLALAACGSKGPLVMPTEEPAKPEQPAQ